MDRGSLVEGKLGKPLMYITSLGILSIVIELFISIPEVFAILLGFICPEDRITIISGISSVLIDSADDKIEPFGVNASL